MLNRELSASLLPMIAYPSSEFHTQTIQCLALLEKIQPVVADRFRLFAEFTMDKSQSEMEELYIQAFDMSPGTSLDMSWHIFGETYDRGAFLVAMRQLLKEYGIEELGELPDHAINLLQILPHLDDQRGEDIAVRCLVPGLMTVEKSLQDAESPFLPVIACLRELIQRLYPTTERN